MAADSPSKVASQAPDPSPLREGPADTPSAAATQADDIPPVHVLVAAAQQDRKETEALLTAFDKMGRRPRPTANLRDFVDAHGERAVKGPESTRRPAPSPPDGRSADRVRREAETVVVAEARPQPRWLAWAVTAIVMLVVGGAVAVLAMSLARSLSR